MTITVKLAGGFVHTAGFSLKEMDVAPGTTLADLLALIPIDPSRPMIVARNRRVIRPDEKLEAGDRILISPIFSGG